jgi:tripartite-type tricarboxylate transporter receptor subunit TctC
MKKLILFRRDAALGSTGSAGAQVFPSRLLTIIVPVAASGPTDSIARALAERMRTSLGQPVIIENVTGAGRQQRRG